MWAPLGAILGFFVGAFAFTRIISWIAVLWEAWYEHRIAQRFPHLGMRDTRLAAVGVSMLHSGPWLLLTVIVISTMILSQTRAPFLMWFLGGIYIVPFLFIPPAVISLRNNKGEGKDLDT